jgi:hypothetical protein
LAEWAQGKAEVFDAKHGSICEGGHDSFPPLLSGSLMHGIPTFPDDGETSGALRKAQYTVVSTTISLSHL